MTVWGDFILVMLKVEEPLRIFFWVKGTMKRSKDCCHLVAFNQEISFISGFSWWTSQTMKSYHYGGFVKSSLNICLEVMQFQFKILILIFFDYTSCCVAQHKICLLLLFFIGKCFIYKNKLSELHTDENYCIDCNYAK